MDRQEVFYTTPKRTLEEKVVDILSHVLHYEVPVAAGVLMGTGFISSEEQAAILGSLTALCSGYVQSSHYRDDFVSVYPHYEGNSELERQFEWRRIIGAVRGAVEGCALLSLGLGIEKYFEQVYHFVK